MGRQVRVDYGGPLQERHGGSAEALANGMEAHRRQG